MTINERIKRVRSDTNMTLVEFGKKIGLTKSTVSRMEQNGYAVVPQNVQLICTAFNVSWYHLLFIPFVQLYICIIFP